MNPYLVREWGAGAEKPCLLVVDPAVEDVSALLRDRRVGVELCELAPGGRALDQVADRLAGRRGIGSLHILCHGEPGALRLAGERVDLAVLDARPGALSTIAEALAADAEVVLYGCSVAQGPSGRMFVERLEDALGVRVAASTGPVGAAVLGGGWVLRGSGGVPAVPAFPAAALAAFPGILNQVTLTGGNDTPALSTGDDTVVADSAAVLNSGDVIDGQAGTDVLAISADQTVTLGATTLVNVETVTITAGTVGITTNDATVASGQTLTVNASSSTGVLTWNGAAETDGRFLVSGGTGNDILAGGGGSDTMFGGSGRDVLSGGGGNDVLSGGSLADTLYGGAGDDLLDGGQLQDVLYGGDGNDTLSGGASPDTLSGGNGNDILFGGNGSDNLVGGDGHDTFVATQTEVVNSTSETIDGGTGNDVVQLNGGDGFDLSGMTVTSVEYLTVGTDSATTVTLGDGFTAAAATLTVSAAAITTAGNALVFNGSAEADGRFLITGGAGNDSITAGAGADTISGGAGSDTLLGGGGNDTLSGGNGDDMLSGGAGTDGLLGGAGNDVFAGTAAELGGSSDTVDGGAGSADALRLDGGGSFDLSSLSVSAVEQLTVGSNAATTVTLGNGFTAAAATLTVSAAAVTTAGNAFVFNGAAETDGRFLITGGAGNDSITAGAGSDTLSGGAGSDTLSGGAGADTVSGGIGNDLLFGGAGDDTLHGGSGTDTYSGGSGNDVVSGSASDLNGDTISDFAIGDSIVVTGADLTSLEGTNANSSIDLGIGSPLTLAGISAASGTFHSVFSGGNTTITLVAAPVVTDPVAVNDGTDGSGGGTRTLTNTGSTSGSAAIVQNSGNNGNVVTVSLPASVSLTSEGPATAQSGTSASTTLVNAIGARGPSGADGVIGNTQTFLNRLPATTSLDIRTIVPSVGTGVTTDDPIVITGSGGSGQTEAFVIDMRSIAGKILQVDNIEFVSVLGNATVTGGAGDNYAVGDDNAQFISLGEGNDTLYGGDGSDTIGSAAGNDELFGDGGTDSVNGGTGDDTVWGGTGADVAYGNQDADLVYGNQDADTLFGGQGADVAYGGQDADLVYGNLADDVLYGNMGADSLFGGQGNDALYGGQGDDLLQGNLGDDVIVTGAGADRVVVLADGGADSVTDFDGAAGDRIEIAANPNGTAIDSFAELLAASTDTAGGVQVALGGGNTLTLNGIATSQLKSDWFLFTS